MALFMGGALSRRRQAQELRVLEDERRKRQEESYNLKRTDLGGL